MSEPQGSGDCFSSAVVAAIDLLIQGRDSVMLCHGRPTLNFNEDPSLVGSQYWHAWVEYEDSEDVVTVAERSNGWNIDVPRDVYYAAGRIDESEVTRYAATAIADMLLEYGHYGPWNSEHPPVEQERT